MRRGEEYAVAGGCRQAVRAPVGGVAENGAGEVLGVWELRERVGEGEVENREVENKSEGMKKENCVREKF